MAWNRRRVWESLALGALLMAGCSSADSDAERGDGNAPPTTMIRGSGGTGGKSTAIPGGMVNGNAGKTGTAGTTPAGTGGSGPIDGECAAISQTAENHLQPADIVIAVDNSGSMDEEIVFVREQLNAFSQQIVDSGIDVRIILITSPIAAEMPMMMDPGLFGGLFGGGGDQDNGICIDPPLGSGMCPADSNPPSYLHVPVRVGSNDALEIIVNTFPNWRDQLRPNATKSFVVVTDDDAQTDEDDNNAAVDPAATFTQALTGLDAALFASFRFSGIFCFSDCEQAAEIGAVYKNLVTQTLGVSGDLCLQDFAPVFNELAHAVIEGSMLDCEWAIPPAPTGETFEAGKVNVQYVAAGATAPETVFHVDDQAACGATGGWYYDDNAAATRIHACPSTCELLQGDGGAKVDVLFGCATMDGPD